MPLATNKRTKEIFKTMEMKNNFTRKEVKELLKQQRTLVANELIQWTEDLSIPNQNKIHDLCQEADEPFF